MAEFKGHEIIPTYANKMGPWPFVLIVVTVYLYSPCRFLGAEPELGNRTLNVVLVNASPYQRAKPGRHLGSG